MIKPNKKELIKSLKELRESIAKSPSPLKGLSMREVMKRLRKTREEVWKEKMDALRTRHK